MHLQHKIGINTFFCELAAKGRDNPDASLGQWKSEREFSDGGQAHPDGRGVWREGDRQVHFYLEFDRGTEALKRLGQKMTGYQMTRKYYDGSDFVVLFYFLSERREANARRALAEVETWIRVATASRQPNQEPHQAIWLPLNEKEGRRRLAELGHPIGQRSGAA